VSPAAALAAAPVATWPVAVVGDDGRQVGVADALGRGGVRVAAVLGRIAGHASPPADLDLGRLAAATPGGAVIAPLVVVDQARAAQVAGTVDASWLTKVDRRRSQPRPLLAGAGRATELEAALHLAMLLATLPVAEDAPPEARVASGARLWLLGGVVAWALLGDVGDPFAAWGELVSYGMWPVGPVGGRLVVAVGTAPPSRGPGGCPAAAMGA
jgi:hypothetical protein